MKLFETTSVAILSVINLQGSVRTHVMWTIFYVTLLKIRRQIASAISLSIRR